MRADCDKEVMIVCSFYLDTKRNVWKCLRHGLSIPGPGTGRGWGPGGEAMGSSERNNDNYSFLGAAAGPRGAGPPQPRPSCNQGIK